MARAQRDIKGWQYFLSGSDDNSLVETENSPSKRRTRRGKQDDEKITLRREIDDLEVKKGDTILVQDASSDSTEVALIQEIRFGNDKFLDIVVLWFIRMENIEHGDLPKESCYEDIQKIHANELFITAYLEEISLTDIIDKVQVLSAKEFEKDIVVDESIESNIFMCRRGCDPQGEIFTDEFDFRFLVKDFDTEANKLLDFIRERTVPRAYAKKSSKQATSIENTPETKSKTAPKRNNSGKPRQSLSRERSSRKKMDKNNVTNEETDKTIVQDEDIEEVTDEEFSDGESYVKDSRKRSKSAQVTPRRNRSKASKLDDESRKYINTFLSPLKKKLKIKQDASKPSFLAFSPKKSDNKQSNSPDRLGIDSTSEVFKQVKAKLHASTRLSSLPCREDEFTSVYLNLETAIQEETGCCLYISGTPGVGKTATVREVISQLKELVVTNDIIDFDYLEINGLKLLSPETAYEILWEKISGLKVSPSNAALLLESYFVQDTERKPLIVLMDELDQIVTKKQNVMYNFFNWPTYSNSKFIVIAVANTMDLPERVLTNKISSRLGLRRIQFIGYTFEQLGSIITHRLDMLTKQNKKRVTISADAIGFASRKVASVSGDARRALTICRRAVEIAENDYIQNKTSEEDDNDVSYTIQISHISKAINETLSSPISQYLASLPFAAKLVLVAILTKVRRSGLAENSLGDIIDEIKNLLFMSNSKSTSVPFEAIEPNSSIDRLLYHNGLVNETRNANIRILHFKHIINELIEDGILVQQPIQSERYRTVSLDVSEEEIISVLHRDKDMSGFI